MDFTLPSLRQLELYHYQWSLYPGGCLMQLPKAENQALYRQQLFPERIAPVASLGRFSRSIRVLIWLVSAHAAKGLVSRTNGDAELSHK